MTVPGLFAGLRRLAWDRSGASAMLTVLTLPVLLGLTAFAIDGGMAYASKRAVQNAADSAAFSAAAAKADGYSNLDLQARAVAREYGLEDGRDEVAVAVASPAATGPRAGQPDTVEVTITRPMLTFFSSLLGGSTGTVRGRAVAVAGRSGAGCILVLDPTASWAVLVNGFPDLELDDCELQVNSTATQAMLVNGSPTLTAKGVKLGGGYLVNGAPILNIADGIRGGQSALPDPYDDRQPPSGTCTYTNHPPLGAANASIPNPTRLATFCGGLTINALGSPTISFAPGVYVFTGDLIVNGAPRVVGDGVTFVLTGSARLVVNGSARLELRAPTSGATAGFIFFAETGSGEVILNGDTRSELHGAMYFPTRKVTINGSNGVRGDCLQLVARTLLFNGGGTFGVACGDVGLGPMGFKASALVE